MVSSAGDNGHILTPERASRGDWSGPGSRPGLVSGLNLRLRGGGVGVGISHSFDKHVLRTCPEPGLVPGLGEQRCPPSRALSSGGDQPSSLSSPKEGPSNQVLPKVATTAPSPERMLFGLLTGLLSSWELVRLTPEPWGLNGAAHCRGRDGRKAGHDATKPRFHSCHFQPPSFHLPKPVSLLSGPGAAVSVLRGGGRNGMAGAEAFCQLSSLWSPSLQCSDYPRERQGCSSRSRT